jgi:hypothetical protein
MKKVCLLVFCFFVANVFAEDKKLTKYIEIKSNGQAAYFDAVKEYRKIVVWAKTKGNQSLPFEFISSLPSDAKIKAYGSRFTNKEDVRDLKRFWPITLKSTKEIAADRAQCIELGLGDKDDPQEYEKDKKVVIPKVPDFDKSLYCKLYNWDHLLALGVNCFPKSLFSKVRSVSDYFDLYGLFRKDACGSSKDEYVIRIDVDLSQVNWEQIPNYTTSFRIKTLDYAGKKRASIKPKSDGRFAPRPIILMEWLNNLCGNKLTMTKWSGGRPASPKELSIYSFYLHRDDLILGLAVVDKVLKGGKGTFELSDGYQGYGVCFELMKKRQKANGYS